VGAGGWSPRALERDAILELVESFAAAARRAAEAGCDFVGIHGAHGYLLSQFLSPYCNKRDDEYGGDLAGRMRFPLAVVAAVRRSIGQHMPVVFRISGDEHQHNGLTLADVCLIAPHLAAAGVDLIDVSAGMYETNWWITQPMEMPQGVLAPLASEVRKHVDVPVSVSGRITDPSVAEHLLESGTSDFVTLGRALHADPEFPVKARDGRLAEICTCVACNQGCSDMHARGAPIVCLVNTTTGREREYAIRRTTAARRVVVVGGGPAGLECARVLALRGHGVTLFERDDEPGGQLLLSRLVPGREELAGHLPWLVAECRRAGVRLETGVDATAAMTLAERPDLIVVATGAAPGLPAIPGIMDSPVVNPYEVLRRPIAVSGRALVIGGGIRGVGVARVLADKGIQVVLVEVGRELVADVASRSRRFQIGALTERPNVTVRLGTTVEALGEHDAVLWNGTERVTLSNIGLVVPTRTLLPVTRVSDDLYAHDDAPPIFLLGDCVQPRTALEAIHEAAALGHRL
jgi:2,4-dienoyl-CoA reductase-like NADH-dependent reductase (Old Yellow Enzyme family)